MEPLAQSGIPVVQWEGAGFADHRLLPVGSTPTEPARNVRISSDLRDTKERQAMIVAEISIAPLGTESTSVSRYVAAAVKELEASGLKCLLGPMGTTVEAGSVEEVYTALTKAQAAVFAMGIERAYTVVKMDERRDSGRSSGDMVSAVRGKLAGER